MVRHLTLIQFTEKGISEANHSIQRAEKFRAQVEKAGGKIIEVLWTIGEVDGAIIFEAPEEQTAAALMLKLGEEGYVRTRTLRAYNAEEFQQVLAR